MSSHLRLLIFCIFYSCFIGVFTLPQGFGAALVALIALCAVTPTSYHTPQNRVAHGASLLAALTIVALADTTNHLTRAVGYQIVSVVILWLALGRAASGTLPVTLAEVLRAWLLFLKGWAHGLRHAQGFPRMNVGIDPMYMRGTAGAIPVLVVLHLLLGRVNEEYASFMRETLELVLSPVFWVRALHSLFLFYAVVTFRAVQLEPEAFKNKGSPVSQAVTVSLLTGATLLLVFDFFQVRLIGRNPLSLPFKDFSLYVQRGFWELLCVSVVGYGWWSYALHRGAELGATLSKNRILRLFAVLLLLLAGFALHKIIGLQFLYGLKDTRLYASAATLLLAFTFLGGALAPMRPLFTAQVYGLLLSALTLSAINADSFVTRVYPIRVPGAESMAKDYSYLLTNSYDNYREWGELMLEMQREGAQPPQGYYWGDYRPLCITQAGGAKRNLLKEHHQKLLSRVISDQESFSGLLRGTFRERGAVKWLRANQGLVEDALKVAEESCVPWGPSSSY